MTLYTSDKQKMSLQIESPCIRNCCLDAQDICAGCFRHINEIVGWQQRSDVQKNEILQLCEQRKRQKS